MRTPLIFLCAALLAAGPAWAHGNASHGTATHGSHTAAKQQQAWGIAGEARQVQRTIALTMTDNMRFSPERIEVKQGETVRLRVRNAGKLLHELVIGTRETLAAHADAMLKNPTMDHDEAHMVHVDPGKTGEIIWTFNRAGEFEFACLIAGHFQAGMKGTIRVVSSSSATDTNNPEHRPAAYAGQQQRDIKSLSAQDQQAYAQGQGHGFAKAAELNGYPGPLHVLELAAELGLDDQQRRQSEALMARHRSEARRLGQELIDAERALDQAFASRSVDADALQQLTQDAGLKHARLRAEHLRTHLSQTALMTPQQIARYNSLRGYDTAHRQHTPEMSHGHQPAHR